VSFHNRAPCASRATKAGVSRSSAAAIVNGLLPAVPTAPSWPRCRLSPDRSQATNSIPANISAVAFPRIDIVASTVCISNRGAHGSASKNGRILRSV
jgi:hypothetical protein